MIESMVLAQDGVGGYSSSICSLGYCCAFEEELRSDLLTICQAQRDAVEGRMMDPKT